MDTDTSHANSVFLDEATARPDFYKRIHPKVASFANYLDTHLVHSEVIEYEYLMDGCIRLDNTGPYPLLTLCPTHPPGGGVQIAYIHPTYEEVAWQMYAHMMHRIGDEAIARPVNRGYPIAQAFLEARNALFDRMDPHGVIYPFSIRVSQLPTYSEITLEFDRSLSKRVIESALQTQIDRIGDEIYPNRMLTLTAGLPIPPLVRPMIVAFAQLPFQNLGTQGSSTVHEIYNLQAVTAAFRKALGLPETNTTPRRPYATQPKRAGDSRGKRGRI